MEGAKAASGVSKMKKKQVKNELDRMKQAEKKKKRLEKALATSAAIRSELEKKKEKKKEEQQRLDEEGAAIAESVALHVLLDEDSDDTMQKKDTFRRAVFPRQNLLFGCTGDEYGNGDWMVSYEPWGRRGDITGISPHLIAEQAISSLQIWDDTSLIGR